MSTTQSQIAFLVLACTFLAVHGQSMFPWRRSGHLLLPVSPFGPSPFPPSPFVPQIPSTRHHFGMNGDWARSDDFRNPFNPFENSWDSGNQWSSGRLDGQMRPLGGVGLPTSGGPWVEGTWDNSNTWSNDGQNTITNNDNDDSDPWSTYRKLNVAQSGSNQPQVPGGQVPNFNQMGVSNNNNNNNNNFNGMMNNPWAPNGQFPSPNGQFPSPNGQFPSPNGQFPSPNGQFPSPNGQFPGANEQFPFVNSRFSNTNNGFQNFPNSQQSGFLNQMPGGPMNGAGFADNQPRPWWRK